MRKVALFFSLLFAVSSFAGALQDRSLNPEALRELASYLGIPPEADLVVETQKRWLRKPTQERWEMAELSEEERAFVLNWGITQHLFDDWKPNSDTFDQALILGATTGRMEMRLNYLKTLWEEGTRFREIVWLTGDRPLDPRIDDLTDRSSNESEAAHILWDESDLPEEMRNLPVLFVAVPMFPEGRRPNTYDTLIAWLEEVERPCKALFISDQPFCGYQLAIVQSTLPETFDFDLVGKGIDPMLYPTAATVTLDSIARMLYQERLFHSKGVGHTHNP